jgi:hypothetical protein
MSIEKDKIVDLLLRVYFVNNSPAVGGAFVMAWNHGMELDSDPGVTYHEQFADMCENLGLPRELPKPEYPKRVWAAYNAPDGATPIWKTKEVFSGTPKEVREWARVHKGEYHHIGPTERTFTTEKEEYEKWKAKILKDADLI